MLLFIHILKCIYENDYNINFIAWYLSTGAVSNCVYLSICHQHFWSVYPFSSLVFFDVLRLIFINKTVRSATVFSHEPAEYGIELPLCILWCLKIWRFTNRYWRIVRLLFKAIFNALNGHNQTWSVGNIVYNFSKVNYEISAVVFRFIMLNYRNIGFFVQVQIFWVYNLLIGRLEHENIRMIKNRKYVFGLKGFRGSITNNKFGAYNNLKLHSEKYHDCQPIG